MDKQALVEQIKAWAMENYEKSWGASVIIECFEDEDIAEQFKSLDEAKEYAQLQSEQYQNAWCDA